MERITLVAQPEGEYQLLDSGREEKLEKYGQFVLARPDPQALWERSLSESEWAKAQGRFVRSGREGLPAGRQGGWRTSADLPKEWPVSYSGLTFSVRPTSFKHTGLFPEQAPHWEWAQQAIQNAKRPIKVLNLFAYTGGATLACAQAGAEVTHVDASKTAVAWARENAALSNLADKPIRWMVEDVLVFIKREIKRGNRYDAIIMDPPAFGHGPKDELWKIEESLLELIGLCNEVLSDNPLFIVMSGYAAGYSPLAFAYNLEPLIEKFGGGVEYGDLAIQQANSARMLPCGIFARWHSW